MFSIFIMVIVWLILLYWGGFRFTTFCSLLFAVWAIYVQLLNGESSLLFWVWGFFLALNIMDINASNTRKNEPEINSKEEQNYFNMRVKEYRKELEDELDDDFE